MNSKSEHFDWRVQDEWYIKTTTNLTAPNKVFARIYDDEQRQTINRLIALGYIPLKTSVGRGLSTQKHWNLEPYKGRYGEGYKLITSSPLSNNFNHITYFINY